MDYLHSLVEDQTSCQMVMGVSAIWTWGTMLFEAKPATPTQSPFQMGQQPVSFQNNGLLPVNKHSTTQEDMERLAEFSVL